MTDGLLATLSVDAMLSTLLGSQLVSRPLNQDRTFLSLNRRGEKEESNGGTDGMLICVATCSAAAALSSLSPTVNRANKHGSWIFKILGTPFCTQIFCLLFRNNECHSTYGCSTEVPSRRRRARGGQGRARGDRAGRVPRPRDRPSHNTQRMLPPRRTRNVSTTWFHSCCLSLSWHLQRCSRCAVSQVTAEGARTLSLPPRQPRQPLWSPSVEREREADARLGFASAE